MSKMPFLRNVRFLALFLFILTQSVHSQTLEFEKNFKDILQTGSTPGTSYILDGTLIAYKVLDPSPETYTVELTVLQGEWPEPGRIQTYEARFLLSGQNVAERFPERRPRTPGTAYTAPNSKVLLWGEYLRTDRDPEGRPLLIFQGRGVRKIQ